MGRKNHKSGRPQAVKRIRIEPIRRPENEIDQRQFALALIRLTADINKSNKTGGSHV